MSTLNVKIPDEMEEDIESFLERNPHYLNKSELVRDALRHLIAAGEADPGRPAAGDPLFSVPAVTVDDPVPEDDIDDVVYGGDE
ncbi:MAG: ribbon-helix-helix domain-containing protein [Haloarculaceae archaeon]